MIRLLSSDLWKHLRKLGSRSRLRMAAVAYLTDTFGIRFRRGDTLVVDASDGAIRSGETSKTALDLLARRGVHLYSYAGLHAKVFLFDRVAVVGSSNVSTLSRTHLLEAAVLTDQPTVTSQVRAFIEALQNRSLPIDDRFLRRIRSLPVDRRPWRFSMLAGRAHLLRDSSPQTWLVGVKERADEPREEEFVEQGTKEALKHRHRRTSEVPWLRFTGLSNFRKSARAGDSIVEISTALNAKRPTEVYRHAPILWRQEEEGKRTRFFTEYYSDAEQHALSWGEFKKLAPRVGIGRFGQYSQRLLSEDQSQALHSLWGN
jgi:PLD-like domain